MANSDYYDEFEEVWKHYPRRIAKQQAKEAYNARRKAGELTFSDAIAAVRAYASERHGKDDKYTMLGSSFFGPKRQGWKDYLPEATDQLSHYRRWW